MNINATKLAMASAFSALVLWFLCSLLVWWQPQLMLILASDMFHWDIASMVWQLTMEGVITGGLAWGAFAGTFAWLLAQCYNRLHH